MTTKTMFAVVSSSYPPPADDDDGGVDGAGSCYCRGHIVARIEIII
jgi:hypothetical protein